MVLFVIVRWYVLDLVKLFLKDLGLIIICAGIIFFRFMLSSCVCLFSVCICLLLNVLFGSVIFLVIEIDLLCDFICSGVGMSVCVIFCSVILLFFLKWDSVWVNILLLFGVCLRFLFFSLLIKFVMFLVFKVVMIFGLVFGVVIKVCGIKFVLNSV